ncbi:MAG TPA: adenylyltransferase/cytidyltransferase family protein [Patescibacteria group bacterium]|nr:adenylyltransferase/cytidyltransferase family protein [Patescibacteria group bacterium]
MGEIISTKTAIKISSKLKNKKKIVLAGGCFDVLHIGHIKFLEEAKTYGNYLFLILESDYSVKKTKGKNRPVNIQKDRAELLSHLDMVDYVIPLPKIFSDKDYDNLIMRLKPDIIATTKGDKNEVHKKRQVNKLRAKLIYIKKIKNRSTSRIINSL